MRTSLIITAAGSGTRFQASVPPTGGSPNATKKKQFDSKLFFDLNGVPVLERTLRVFSEIPEIHETFVTVPSGKKRVSERWGKERGFHKIAWVEGAATRAGSVLQALQKTSPRNEWVMVHDGARPFIRPKTVRELILRAQDFDGILLASKVVPTLKRVSPSGQRVEATVDRNHLAEAQTPQLIRREVLLHAYQSVPGALQFTDESSLVEAAGGKMGVFLHDEWNPKLTYFSDYELAEAKLTAQSEIRVGKGYDIHRLVKGRKLWIGGIPVAFEKGSLGHSDGDALLHAITDAILGALGWGDIGDWFSDQSSKYKNIRSTKLLEQVMEKVSKQGWSVAQVDANVILEKPKLGLLKMRMRKQIADILGLSVDCVSVKGRTYEGLPPFGTGEAWASEAIVMMKKRGL